MLLLQANKYLLINITKSRKNLYGDLLDKYIEWGEPLQLDTVLTKR